MLSVFIGVFFWSGNSYGQVTYFNESGGGTFLTGWSGTNNITSEPLDKGSYFLVEPGRQILILFIFLLMKG
jgi:hypothetical protein